MPGFRVRKVVCMAIVFCTAAAILSSAQTLTTLWNFGEAIGANPLSAPIRASDGNFYGTTQYGGGCNEGTVYELTPQGTFSVLHNFCGDGSFPWAGLVQGSDGNFYGTTSQGGGCNEGTVYELTPQGTFSLLHNFCGLDGSYPWAGLIQGSDGNFYGTTREGGNGYGTVFKVTPSGTLITLYNFCSQRNCMDGAFPYAGLVQASDGNFYGTTEYGGLAGTEGYGTIFRITPAGALTTLYRFRQMEDGEMPMGVLVQGSDGDLYGTAVSGGPSDDGTIFKISLGGTFTRLYSFCLGSCTDGALPAAGLLQGMDGNFYGTAIHGGSGCSGEGGCGTVFKITSNGTLTTLHQFAGSDGISPYGLVQASNGSFYGTTYDGGTNNGGTIFSLSPVPEQFVPVTPCRLMDTRPQYGGGGPIPGGTFETFNLPQLAQNNHCASLASAAAYSLNVTLVPQNGAPVGYLTIWPAGAKQPVVSTMNSLDGRTKANAAIVPAGVNGGVSVLVSNTANVVLDIDGYFAPAGGQTYEFYSLAPCRVIDTRSLGGQFLTGGHERDFSVLESPCIPQGANIKAYSFNVTVVPHRAGQPLGYLTVWPQGQQQPGVSTLNNLTATTVANAAIVPAGTNGGIAVFASNDTDLVVDINGYFAAPGQWGLSFYAGVPCRALDTRSNNGQPFAGEKTVNVAGSFCIPPSSAKAYVLSATVVPQVPLGYLTLWPDLEPQPAVSTLNAVDGWITSNMAIVPTANGSIDAFASNPTHLVLDISGYFAP